MLSFHSISTSKTQAQPWPNPQKIIASSSSNKSNQMSSQSSSSASKNTVKRLVLSNESRTKLNPESDRDFYSYPRFVTHVDDNFISTLTNLYRERLSPEMEVLDLMSSWVSHLPEEVKYKRVVGHGLNAMELSKNKRLDSFFVKDLNEDQEFQFESCSFDAVLCTVSVQYLQWPEKGGAYPIDRWKYKVFAEVYRILKPGGIFIVSFSNRMFYEKAVSAWREGTEYSRIQLVMQYFQCIEGFTQPEIVKKLAGSDEDISPVSGILSLLGLSAGTDPFYAVIAYRNFKPIHEAAE